MAGQEVAKRTPMEDVCATVASARFRAKIAQGLPENVSLDRFTRVTLTAIQTSPELITADRQSLYNSVIRCAQDGLIPDGREAALVIFKVKGQQRVQYLPMILGLRKKAAESGFSLSAYVVHEADTFTYALGLEPSVTHEPPKLGDERGDPLGAYAVATNLATGEKYLEVMSRAEIEQVRAVSRAATSEYGPWVNWWGEQARKTVARRLFKQLPLGATSERTAGVLDAIDSEYDFPNQDVMSVEEANVSASLMAGVPADDGGPDDVIDGDYFEGVPPHGDDAIGQGKQTFAEQAETSQRKRAAKAAE